MAGIAVAVAALVVGLLACLAFCGIFTVTSEVALYAMLAGFGVGLITGILVLVSCAINRAREKKSSL